MKKAFTLSEALVTLAIIGVLAAILIPVVNNARPDKDKIVYKKALYSLQTAVSDAMNSAYMADGFGDGSGSIWGNNGIGGNGQECNGNIANWWGGQCGNGSGSGSGGTGNGNGGGTGGGNGGEPTHSFCNAVAGSLNIAGKVNCGGSTSSYDNPNFITTDGIRYWGLEDDSAFQNTDDDQKYKDIYVDRSVGQGEKKSLGRIRMKGEEITSNDDLGMKIRVKWNGQVYTPDDDAFGYENDIIESSLDVVQRR